MSWETVGNIAATVSNEVIKTIAYTADTYGSDEEHLDLNDAPLGWINWTDDQVLNPTGINGGVLLTTDRTDNTLRVQFAYSLDGQYALRYRVAWYDFADPNADENGFVTLWVPAPESQPDGFGWFHYSIANPEWDSIANKPETFGDVPITLTQAEYNALGPGRPANQTYYIVG